MQDESNDTPELFELFIWLFNRKTPFAATRAKFPLGSNDKLTKLGTITTCPIDSQVWTIEGININNISAT